MSGKLVRILVKNQHKLKYINKTDGQHLIEHLNNYMQNQKNLHEIISFNVGGKIYNFYFIRLLKDYEKNLIQIIFT